LLLDKNKDTIIITTFENKEVGHLQTFKFYQNKKINHPVQNQTLHIFQMVNNLGNINTPSKLEHLKMGV